MAFTLADILPNANTGLSQIGFFFGAGSSFTAGYPLTFQLTIDVLKRLSPDQVKLIEKILETESITLNITEGTPDIELLSDKINKAKASYIKNRGLKDQHYKKLILGFLDEYKTASKEEIYKLILDILPGILDKQQRENKVRNILYAMSKRDKSIVNQGTNRKPVWKKNV